MKNFIIKIFIISSMFCCAASPSPEESLLQIFKEELLELKTFFAEKKSYSLYLEHQIKSLPAKREKLNHVVAQINHKFSKMDIEQRWTYQKKWQKEFGPIISEMVYLTKNFDEKIKSESQTNELAIKAQVIEENYPKLKLTPHFFVEAK